MGTEKRLLPLIKFSHISGNILLELVDSTIYSQILFDSNVEYLTTGGKVTIEGCVYMIEKISIIYTDTMYGNIGIPRMHIGIEGRFNTVINFIVKEF